MSFTQTSIGFLRIKSQSGAEVLNIHRQHGHCSQDADLNHEEALSEESGHGGPGSHSSVEGSGSDTETDCVVHKLQAELEEERTNNQCICAKLAEEMEKHQHVLSLLEKEKKSREDEQKEKEVQLQDLQTQLSQVQYQCLEMQKDKEEKEKLKVLEMKKRLQEEEDAEKRYEEVASSGILVQNLEKERQSQEEEIRRLKEEVEQVRQLLETEKEQNFRGEGVIGLKASKNQQNQAKAGFSCDDRSPTDEANLESGPDQDSMNELIPGDIMIERYLSSAPLAHSQSSVVSEGFEHRSQLDISADYRLVKCILYFVCVCVCYELVKSQFDSVPFYSFELNSEVLGDEPLLSISNRLREENTSSPQCYIPVADNFNPQSLSEWPHNSTSGDLEISKLSEQQFEETDLEKELLHQQCGELHEELALKDRDLNVLREEVIKSAEELEEARSR